MNDGVDTSVLPGNTQIGTCVVLFFETNGSNLNLIAGITSAIGTFTQVNSNNHVADAEIWICQKTTGAGSQINTAGGGVGFGCFALEYPAVLSFASITPVGSNTPVAQPTCTATVAVGQAMLAMVKAGGNAYSSVYAAAPASPWTITGNGTFAGSSNPADVAYQTIATGTSATAGWTLTGNAGWQTQGVLLTPVPATGGLLAFF